jgi:hypothetical protein
VNDTNYNSTFLPVALAPGEVTSVGTLFLSEFGTASGEIVDGSNYTPLRGAEVEACPTFSEGTCAPSQTTNALGQYSFSAAPGQYVLAITATNYASGNATVTVLAGVTTAISTILLNPLGTNALLDVTGRVLDNTSGIGINGATVAALVNGSVAQSRITSFNGSFVLPVQFGTYELKVTYEGDAPYENSYFVVHAAVSNLVIRLVPMTYEVVGVVTDGLTHAPLSGVVISVGIAVPGGVTNGAPLATTDSSGGFILTLSNGTHLLYAQGNAADTSVAYAPLEFSVVINGAPQSRDLSMTPALTTLNGRVVDASTGLPLSGATVQIVGQVDGIKYARTFTTGTDGAFTTQVFVGAYLATTSYGAYQSAQKSFTAAGLSTNVTLALEPLSTPVTAANSQAPGWEIWGAVGISAAAIGASVILVGRPIRRTASPVSGAGPAQSK